MVYLFHVLLTRASRGVGERQMRANRRAPRGFFVAFGRKSLTHPILISRGFRGINRPNTDNKRKKKSPNQTHGSI